MYIRSLMRKGEKITLLEESAGNGSAGKRVFTIIARDGTGASSVSYLASCGRKTGRLKEFYPSERNYGKYLNIVRDKNNQLKKTNDCSEAARIFNDMINDYIESYHILEEAKKEAAKGNNSFSTFIPSFEILRGCNKKGEPDGSVYIWTVDNDGDFETFEEFLDKVHMHPAKNPAKDLFIILNTLYNLTECVKVLHSAGLIHGDIKPDNFGFSLRGGRYLTEPVQLFDINSIYSVYTKFPRFSATTGFGAPEVFDGRKSNQSDLYSIGTVLFHAIASEKDFPDRLYSDSYYERIDEIVADSLILKASPVTYNTRVQYAVSSILKKCLAKDLKDRIDNADELKEAIKKAIALLIPSQYNDYLDTGYELKVVEIEKELEKYNESDAVFALQTLLFNHPIYECRDNKIRIFILGCGVYGQLFLDVCLQAGQIIDKSLEVCVVTKDKELYKKEYLDGRSALKDFFEIDGEGDTSETNYGKIVFVSPEEASGNTEFSKGFIKGERNSDKKYNKALAQNIIQNNKGCNYLFISLGDEALNNIVADACNKAAKHSDVQATVAFVGEENAVNGCIAVNVRAKAEENENYSEIERMGFNTHLCWNSPLKLNINLKKAYKDYKDKYNHDSSIACVLSIKYKLYSVGIEIDELAGKKLARAAAEYEAFIRENREAFAALVNIEHRRWIVEKITQGWTCRTDYSECLQGTINDKKKKLHPCIAKSRCDFNLEKYFKSPAVDGWNKSKWNSPCKEDRYLDDLDMVSLNLHRTFFKHAEQIKKSFSLKGEEFRRILSMIQYDKRAMLAFDDWMLCLQRIWETDEKQAKFYDGYKDAFLESVKAFSKNVSDEILKYVGIIDSKAMPVILAYRLRDYKASDKDLVEAIPFILTHRSISLFVPLMTGDTTERFNNVASATLINPDSITYAAYLRKYEDIRDTKDTIMQILTYLQKKDIRSGLKLILLSCADNNKVNFNLDELKCFLSQADKSRIKQVKHFVVGDEAELCSYLSENVNTDTYESNSSYLSALLTEAGFYKARASFSFDSAKKEFSVSDGCRWLKYIRGGQSMTVSDMLSFNNSSGKMNLLPEYYNFDSLWKLYKNKSTTWKDMCKVLEKHAENNDLIASFNRSTDFSGILSYEFIIPDELRDGYNYVISYLRDNLRILGQDSRIEYNTIESCCVVLSVSEDNSDAVKKLFAEPQRFVNAKYISVVETPEKAEIYYDTLTVNSLRIEDYPEFAGQEKKISKMLQALQSHQYIFNLKNFDDNEFSFVYSSKQSKRLMTSPGKILEIYIYHRLRESGFDDVVSGYEITKEDSSVKFQIDCMLTSGFRSVMIKCETQDNISRNCYEELSVFAGQLGINAVPVLIADMYEKNSCRNVSDQKSEQGKCPGVYTISEQDEINNIDKTISRILSGRY